LCYVDHHDKAYQWAEKHKLKLRSTISVAPPVEVDERVEKIRYCQQIGMPLVAAGLCR